MGALEDKGKTGRAARSARLAAALRENLRKRKAQSRGRGAAEAPEVEASDPADPPDEGSSRES